MRNIFLGATLGAMALPATAFADCGEVSITDMNWASSAIVTQIAKFLMEQGYGCEVVTVPSDTVPAITSVAENNEPDILTELWQNSAGAVYDKLKEQGKVREIGQVMVPGGIEGWWVPTYLIEEHPELATIEGIMANPDLVGGLFNNCPDGWACRIVNDNNAKALGLEAAGIKVFGHGSGETLATSLASAYEAHEPWFGYYWAPTEIMGKYDMTRIPFGEFDAKIHLANTDPDNPNPQVSDYAPAPVFTVITTTFEEQEPEIVDLMSKMTFKTETMNSLLAWMDENNANAEEAAVYFLRQNPDDWSAWLNDEARGKLAKLLK